MNKRTAKKIDKIDSKLMEIYDLLEQIISDEIDEQVVKASDYADEHENSEKAQEKLERLEEQQTELNEILEEIDSLRSRLQDVIEEDLNS